MAGGPHRECPQVRPDLVSGRPPRHSSHREGRQRSSPPTGWSMSSRRGTSRYRWLQRDRGAVETVTMEQRSRGSNRGTTRPERRTPPPVCGCGQDLDVCSGRHCPRCGTSLLAHAAW